MAADPEQDDDEVTGLLSRGEQLLAEARATMEHLEAAMNTAVNVIPPFALEPNGDAVDEGS